MSSTADEAQAAAATGGEVEATQSIAAQLAGFCAHLQFDDLPAEVVHQAKLHLLDSIGIAYASGAYAFAKRSLLALDSLSSGGSVVVGHQHRLAMRDAVLINGILVHGLDYDDTHVPGVVHPSASAFPTALAVAAQRHLSGRDLLTAYVAGVEISARLGAVARGGFHQVGFHPTGLVGALSCAALTGRLQGLGSQGIAQAQGVVGSMASGLLAFLDDGTWTKRMHPGWAGTAGITASTLAGQGFLGPHAVYEGRYGLYATHLPPESDRDLTRATADLGRVWELHQVAIKLYPACHMTHAFIDAALTLATAENLAPSDIAAIRCPIAEGEIGTVCEPRAAKLRPSSDYEAQFSLPFVVAAALTRGRFTLAELDTDALADPTILELAQRVTYTPDRDSGFPHHYSGEVIIETHDGRTLQHREQINRGAEERPVAADEIDAKFHDNMALVANPTVATRVRQAVLSLEQFDDTAAFAEQLGG